MLNSYAGTFENFQSFSAAVPVEVKNIGKKRLIFRSTKVGFTLLPGQSKVLEPALHVYKVYTQVHNPVFRGGIFEGKEPESEVEVDAGIGNVEEAQAPTSEAPAYGGHGHIHSGPGPVIIRRNIVNISIASIAYSSPVLFMVHEGQAVEGASFTSSVPIVPRSQN